MSNPTRIPAPNYTQVPNVIFELMADKEAGLTEKELKVLLAIARKTFGWHKKRDKISLTQLEELTSMSRASVVAGIKAAVKRGIVRQTPDKKDKRGGVFYELIVEDFDQSNDLTSSNSELVQNINQSKNYTRTSSNFEPELVQILNTQKKDKETIKETPTPSAPIAKHNGVGGGEIATLLDEYNIGAADTIAALYRQQYPTIDAATVRQSIDNLLADGVPKGTIVKRLQNRPPEPGKPYQRSRAAPKASTPLPTRPVMPPDMLTPAQLAERARAKRAERDTS